MPDNAQIAEAADDDGAAWTDCMRRQDLAGAWAIGDRILDGRGGVGQDDPAQPYHLRWVWDGTQPDGLAVLVRCYHGLGDTLQFVRFLPALRIRAAHVTLEAPSDLCALLSGLPGVDRLVAFDAAAPLPAGPCCIEIMELPHVLRVGPDELWRGPYLTATPLGPTGGIGLCWQAGSWDAARSVPLASLLAACAAPGRRFASLQRGQASVEATDAAFVNPGDADTDIVRTASLIAGTAIVVTVDTMVAHLAGALGHRVMLLLKHDADWRWPPPGQACPWYPTMTVLHQHRPGHWAGALADLARALK